MEQRAFLCGECQFEAMPVPKPGATQEEERMLLSWFSAGENP